MQQLTPSLLGDPKFIGPSSLGVFLAMTLGGAWAQTNDMAQSSGGTKRVFSVVPRLSITETFTDNVSLATTGKQSELTTEVSPGIRITSESGRLKGYLDYSFRQTLYAQNTSSRSAQNALNAFGTIEAIDNTAYLDFSGVISQQAISALGTQSVGTASINSNLTESTTLMLSPHVRGRLGSFANYVARYSITTNRSQSALVSDVTSANAQVQLNGQSSFARLGWSLGASRQGIAYGAGRSTEADSLSGSLNYSVTPQLNLSLTGGQESNNYATPSKESNWTSGFAVNWIPSESTRISASRQNRSFGESHSISFDHRTARTAWRFSDSKDVSSTPSQIGFASLGSIYDLYFAQFATLEPDPIKRAALVNGFLQANGISPTASVVSSFLTSAASLQRRQDMSFALLGVRDTITFTATRSEGTRLDTIAGASDDLANSAVVRQHGFSVNYAHKLTPDAAFNILASTQHASSTSQGLQDTATNLVNLSLSTRVGTQSTAVLGIRRVAFESNTAPYTETAITGTLNVQF